MSCQSTRFWGFDKFTVSHDRYIKKIFEMINSKFLRTEHRWLHSVSFGFEYTATTKVSAGLGLFGVESHHSFSFSSSYNYQNGGSEITTEKVTRNSKCYAAPMTKTTCVVTAKKGELKVGYTIYWKNAPNTHGVYEQHGWLVQFHSKTRKIGRKPHL